MSVRKLFENVSTSEFTYTYTYTHIHWALFDIKSKNNEQCIKSHYIALNVHSGKPGLLVKCNLTVTVNGKYPFLYRINILWLDPISIF